MMKCLAPMDGITDMPFRAITRKINPEVWLFSEFTNIRRIAENNGQRLRSDTEDARYIVQVFGNTPEDFARAVPLLEDMGCGGININMGCPSQKIANSQHGAALMKAPDVACRIVEACVEATHLPISVKTRVGWRDASQLVSFARALESSGLSMLIIHGRTYSQKFKGAADWEPIYALKESLGIRLVGNGDVDDHEEGVARLGNLDGYMIGRASYGNPWVFCQRSARQQLTLADRLEVMGEHYTISRRFKPERRALLEFRKHLAGYLDGFDPSDTIRKEFMSVRSESEFLTCIQQYR